MTSIRFQEWLLNELEKRGMSQSELARTGNISQSQISNVISGSRSPGFDFCASVSQAFGLPIEQIYRIAGLLPPKPDQLPEIEEINYLLNQLSPDEREIIVENVRSLIRIKKRRENYATPGTATAET